NGSFDFEVPRGRYTFSGWPFPYPIRQDIIDVANSDVTHDIVAAVKFTPIDGRVVRSDGAPVPFARILTTDSSNSQTMTSPAGTFRIYVNPTAKTPIVAQKEGLPPASAIADKSPLKIVISTPVMLTGVVRDRASKPVADVAIVVSGAYIAYTKADGTFSAMVARGPACIRFVEGGYRDVAKQVNITDSTPPFDITLAKLAIVKGQVVDADGKPVQSVHVAIASDNESSDATGEFTFYNVEEGAATIRFGPYLAQEQKVTVPSADVKLVLARTRKLKGKVVDGATHAAVTKFIIEHDDTITPVESSTGQFEIDIERQSPFTVRAPGYLAERNRFV